MNITKNKTQDQFHKYSQIQSLLQNPFNKRTPKIVKKIKHNLKDFQCFKVNENQVFQSYQSTDLRSQLEALKNQQKINKNQNQQVLKKDIQIFINIISMYSEIVYYSKGQIIDVTGSKKQRIRILIKGDVGIFEPTNNTSFKNCIQKYKAQKIGKQANIMTIYNEIVQKMQESKYTPAKLRESGSFSSQNQQISEEKGAQQVQNKQQQKLQFDQSKIYQIINPLHKDALTTSQAINLLTLGHIIAPFTPHRITLFLQNEGKLLSSIKNQFILGQSQVTNGEQHQISTFSSICFSNQAAIMEIDFSVYKEIISIINNNQRKPYVSCLMNKFQYLSFNDAIDYLKKRSSMIDIYKKSTNENQNGTKKGAISSAEELQKNEYLQEMQIKKNSQLFLQSEAKKSRLLIQNIYEKQQTGMNFNEPYENQKLRSSNQTQWTAQLQLEISIVNVMSPQKIVNRQQNSVINKEPQQKVQSKFTITDIKNKLEQAESLSQSFSQEQFQLKTVPKNLTSSLYYQLPFSKRLYLIVQGEVIIVINKISQYKILDPKHANLRKVLTSHQILKLYSNDVFGMESIGKQKQYGLKYWVRKNSKLLKLEKKTLQQHFSCIPQFKQQVDYIFERRDQLLGTILKNLQNRLQKQMIKKYWDNFGVLQKQKESKQKQINTKIQKKAQKSTSSTNRYSNLQIQSQRKQSLKSSLHLSTNSAFFSTFNNKSINPINSNIHFPQIQSSTLKSKKIQSCLQNYSSLNNKIQLRQIQFIGKRQFPEVEKLLLKKLQKKQKLQSQTNSQRLTVELLKQFKLVDFKSQEKYNEGKRKSKSTFIVMRNASNGTLIRKRAIPSLEQASEPKNHKKIQKLIMRKIGLLSQAQKVKHNLYVVKNRQSPIKYQNTDQKQRKQLKRLTKIAKSVPKIDNFYSKKAQTQYNNTKLIKINL